MDVIALLDCSLSSPDDALLASADCVVVVVVVVVVNEAIGVDYCCRNIIWDIYYYLIYYDCEINFNKFYYSCN
jgi:hypothetical protein